MRALVVQPDRRQLERQDYLPACLNALLGKSRRGRVIVVDGARRRFARARAGHCA
jgi:hypothetical protein